MEMLLKAHSGGMVVMPDEDNFSSVAVIREVDRVSRVLSFALIFPTFQAI